MAQWLIYGSSDPQEMRVFVKPADILAVKETNDGHSRLLLVNGAEVAVSAPALSVMAVISDPPPAPAMVAQLASPTDTMPLLSGAAEPFSTVIVRDGAVQVAVTKADATERWSVNSAPLAPGAHTLVATQTSIFGLTSKASAPCSLNIADPAPPPPPPPPVVASDPAPEAPAVENPASAEAPSETSDGSTVEQTP